MRVRMEDANGDYQFGKSASNFQVNTAAAVAQLILNRLLTKRGEWFLDTTFGTPWFQDIIGYGTAPHYDLAIQDVVLNTPGVAEITTYSSYFNQTTRALSVSFSVQTIFDPTPTPVNVIL